MNLLSRIQLFLCFLLSASSAFSADIRTTLVQAITTNDLSAQATLIRSLVDSNDPLVPQILGAWRQGAVYLQEVDGGGQIPFLLETAVDANGQSRGIKIADGQPMLDEKGQKASFTATDLTAADTSAKLRKVIKTTLDVLSLADPNPNIRRDAASKLGLEQNEEYIAYFLERATKEQNAHALKAPKEAVAITQLISDKPDVVLDAIRKLEALRSIPALDFLKKMEAEGKAKPGKFNPETNAALSRCTTKIDHHIALGNFFGTCFRGLSLSAVLLIAAMGLAITFGLMGIINMAHGEMIMIGAYTAYVTQITFVKWFGQGTRGFDWYFVAALPLSFLVAGSIGLLLERGIIRFLYKRPLESLLATWGVSLVLQQAVRASFGAANVQVYSPSWLSGNFTVGDVILAYNRIFVIFFALAIVIFTGLLLTRTPWGLQVRALMQNRQMAACMGVRSNRVNMGTFGFGCGLAGLAGACLSQIGNVGPSLGQSHIVDCFMVVVLGGVGNLEGTISAALGIGVTDQVLQPHLGAVLGKITVLAGIILFLQWRPAGLFATRSRSLEG